MKRGDDPSTASRRRERGHAEPGTIWLVGMMGAGKSTLGPLLARRLARSFVDLDHEIERESGATIAELFAREGEAGFRERERRAVERVAGTRAVVALGGGAIAQPGMTRRLAASGTVVWLRARPETVLARIGEAEARPLLRGLDATARRAKLESLLGARRAAYATARIAVDTDEGTLEDVVDEIERALGAGAGGASDETAALRRSVRVELGERSYAIEIGAGTLAEAGSAIASTTGATAALVVAAPSVVKRFAPLLAQGLAGAGLRVARVTMPDGDAKKSLAAAARLYDAFLDARLDRRSVVVALGGGVIGDLAGFAAATYLRGIPFVQVPTTVLAMVDASVGGKVGVNLARGKNLVGAFHQPRLVWIDVAVLRTLPLRQRAAGMAEVVKKAALFDEGFFGRLETLGEALLGDDPRVLVPVIERACALKADVVSRDERESGLRMLLNLGHTMGHAIETLTRYRGLLHGEAVSIGMVFAARRSEALGLAPAGTADRVQALLERLSLPVDLPDFERRAYLRALVVDKKRQDARIRYVVLRGIGHGDTVALTPEEILGPARAGKRTRAPRTTRDQTNEERRPRGSRRRP